MVEGLIKFQEKITRKAIRFFAEQKDVSFEDFHNYVNYKMGTEFHENYVQEFYKHFVETRDQKKKALL
jgi:hypothetical protein